MQQMSGLFARRYGIRTARVFCLRHRVEQSGTGQSNPASGNRLATTPPVCLNGSLNRTSIVRQNWIAASQDAAGRPGLPSCGASQVISLSSRISNEPRFRSAALPPDRFVVRLRAAEGFTMTPFHAHRFVL